MATVFVGTYTERLDHVNGRGTGVYTYSFLDGVLRPENAFRGLPSPSYLAVDAARQRLYATSETLEFDGSPQGALQAWGWDTNPAILEPLGHIGTQGGAPCYVSINENHLLAANYVGGSVTAVKLSDYGGLEQIARHVQHTGSGPNPARQEAPHPHAIVPDPTGKYCLVPDLGTDQVHVYHTDNGSLKISGDPVKIHSGAGPRHLVFHSSGATVYLLNELDSSISTLSWKDGHLDILNTVDALPQEYTGERSGADIHVHPTGRFLYASLRGPSSIVCFQIPDNGGLSSPAWFPTHGTTPRNFALDPAGEYLIAANQDSDTLVVFRIDQETGHLAGPSQIVHVPSPACIKIIQ